MMINRRALLRGMVAVAAAPLLPPIAAAAVPAVAGGARIASSAEPLLSYAVGIDDEWNWRAIRARSPQEAVDIWMGEQGLPSVCEAIEDGETDDPCGDCEYCSNLHPDVVRHEEWDGQDVDIGDRLWCASGLGASCARCSDEAWLENGGFFDANGKLICEACETPAEHAARTGEAEA